MGRIIDTIKGLYHIIKNARVLAPIMSGEMISTTRGAQPDVSPEVLVKQYSSWSYLFSTTNARTIAKTNLRVYTKKRTRNFKTKVLNRLETMRVNKAMTGENIQELIDHPAVELLAKPNPNMTGFELMWLTAVYLELTGNGYWYVETNGLNRPIGLYPLQSQYVRVVPDTEEFVKGYLYGKNASKQIALERDEVIHFKYPNPNNLWYGIGPLEAAIESRVRMGEKYSFDKNFYKNNMRPDFMVMIKGRISKEERKRLKAEWKSTHAKTKNAHKPIFLEGDTDIKELSFSARDAQTLQTLKFDRDEMAGIYGVPVSMVELSKSKAEAEANFSTYLSITIEPKYRIIEGALNSHLLPLWDTRIFTMFDNIQPKDTELRLKQMDTRIKNGVTTINEERAEDGWEPRDWGESPWLPLNLAQVSVPRGADTNQAEPKTISCGHDHTKKLDIGEGSVREMTPDEAQFARKLKAFFKRQLEDVLIRLSWLFAKSIQTKDITDNVYDTGKWTTELADELQVDINGWVNDGVERGQQALKLEGSFQVTNPEVQRFIENYHFKFAQAVNKTTEDKLRTAITEGMNAGEGLAEMSKRVDDVMGIDVSRRRADVIARSEVTRAANQGELAAYKDSGIVTEVKWVAFPGECEFCASMDGTTVAVGNAFLNEGDNIIGIEGGNLENTYSVVDAPPLHPNCRCRLQAVVV